MKNLFAELPTNTSREIFERLAEGKQFHLERIVSRGHTTPPGEWLTQDQDEWVVLLKGSAQLLFHGENKTISLGPGDYLLIPAHTRHRVEWTPTDQETVWLAIHFDRNSAE